MQNDSSFGTQGVGARTNNPGNVGNTGIAEQSYPTWQDGVNAVASWLDRHRVAQAVAATPTPVQATTPAPVETAPQATPTPTDTSSTTIAPADASSISIQSTDTSSTAISSQDQIPTPTDTSSTPIQSTQPVSMVYKKMTPVKDIAIAKKTTPGKRTMSGIA